MPYFGWFNTLDSDLGSAFIAKLTKTLMESMKVTQKFAEPRYHNRIGKVERVIGFIQTILRTYNVQFDNHFVTMDSPDTDWTTIESIIPFIQFSINHRVSRFTTMSPAMIMLGDNFNDIPDIVFAIRKIKSGLSNLKLKQRDYNYLNEFLIKLQKLRLLYKKHWTDYCHVSTKQYERRYNLAPTRDKDGNLVKPQHSFGYEPLSSFKKGMRVLYYVGPHQSGVNSKWRQKWTGPWRISHKTSKYRVKIVDSTGNGYDVDVDRLKLFKKFSKNQLMKYNNYEKILEKLERNKPIYSDED